MPMPTPRCVHGELWKECITCKYICTKCGSPKSALRRWISDLPKICACGVTMTYGGMELP